MGFTYSPPSVPLGRGADILIAALYTGSSNSPWQLLPNVQPIAVNWYEGSRPPDARFRYVQGYPGQDANLPTRMEQIFPLDSQGPGVVQADMRVGVIRLSSTGLIQLIFDGFAQAPEAETNEETESLVFTAFGTPVREWDSVLEWALYRSSYIPFKSNADSPTKLRARFNPDGHPNASPSGDPGDNEGDSYKKDARGNKWYFPTFLGPAWPENKIDDYDLRMWTLEMAARYVVGVGSTFQYVDVSNSGLKKVLQAAVPTQPDGNIDFKNPATFDYKPIEVQDIDVSGMAWPEALERLIRPHGFGMCWRMDQDSRGKPSWWLDVYRLDNPTPTKQLYLQLAGSTFDPGATNIGAMHLTRDSHAIANSIHVDTDLIRMEASFILAPNFQIASPDADNLEQYNSVDGQAPEGGTKKYREFILDEAGEGHWNTAAGEWDSTSSKVINDVEKKLLKSKKAWRNPPSIAMARSRPVPRRRKPLNTLCTLKDDGTPEDAKLHVSFDYGRGAPGVWDLGNDLGEIDPTGVWDGTGTWDEVQPGCWDILKDRIGIVFTSNDANAIPAGERVNWNELEGPWLDEWSGTTPIAANNGIMNLVEWLATPGIDGSHTDSPIFRLTVSFDTDMDLPADADASGMSPTQFKIRRQVDATTRFHRNVISRYSYLNPNNDNANGKDEVVLDDLDDANSMAATTVRVHQNAVFAGSATIPRITTAYRPGDKISGIVGRDVNFATNTGLSQGASPIYPSIVQISIDNDGRQSTTIHLSDRRAEFAPMRVHRHRPGFVPRPPAKAVRAPAMRNRVPR